MGLHPGMRSWANTMLIMICGEIVWATKQKMLIKYNHIHVTYNQKKFRSLNSVIWKILQGGESNHITIITSQHHRITTFPDHINTIITSSNHHTLPHHHTITSPPHLVNSSSHHHITKVTLVRMESHKTLCFLAQSMYEVVRGSNCKSCSRK